MECEVVTLAEHYSILREVRDTSTGSRTYNVYWAARTVGHDPLVHGEIRKRRWLVGGLNVIVRRAKTRHEVTLP